MEHKVSNVRIIAFRGTEPNDLKDWVTDASIKLEKPDDSEDDIGIHTGFLSAYNVVHDEVKGWIKGAGGKPVFTCGHSLGGALAVVASVRNRSLPPASCYTFGGPRVGFIAPEKIKTPVYRIVNQGDPVPDVPPSHFCQSRYRHIGDEYQLSDGELVPAVVGGDHVVDRIVEVVEGGWNFAQHFFGKSLVDAVRDAVEAKAGAHGCGPYVKHLEKIAEARNP